MPVRTQAERRRPGTTMVWLAVCLTAIIGIVALGFDGGRMMEERRRAQAAADAAALAAAKQGYDQLFANPTRPPTPSAIVQAGTQSLTGSGYVNNGTTTILNVQVGPSSGQFKGNTSYVEVIVQNTVPATFGRIFTQSDPLVYARAVARFERNHMGLLALQPTGANALTVKGNVAVNVTNEIIEVNSSDPAAVVISGGGSLVGLALDVVGNLLGGLLGLLGALLGGGGGGGGGVTTGAPPAPDPLANLPVPVMSSLPIASGSPLIINGSTTLQPGIYAGGIQINGGTVTMQPGIYVIDGGGLVVAGSATLVGNGVMIYNTGGITAGSIDVKAQASITLSPPTAGPYNEIAIFQDRTVNATLKLRGLGNVNITGVIYAPSAPVHVVGNGQPNGDILGCVICYSFAASGSGTITVNQNPDPPSTYQIRLVE